MRENCQPYSEKTLVNDSANAFLQLLKMEIMDNFYFLIVLLDFLNVKNNEKIREEFSKIKALYFKGVLLKPKVFAKAW